MSVGREPLERRLGDEDLFSNRALRENDPDALGHQALVGPVVDTLETLHPPLNIALFGAWGSGKTSLGELIRRECERRTNATGPTKIRFVRYDASVFGGEALKRNIISFIADDFGLDRDKDGHKKFFAGLYESNTFTDISFKQLGKAWRPILGIAIAWFVFLVALSLGLVALASWATGSDVGDSITKAVPAVVAPSSILSVLGSFFIFFAQSAKVTREETKPSSDEEFTQRFEELIKNGRAKYEFTRLVIFVDELDRCSPEDIALTLTAIRTFLEVDPCVFVVAADRDVLEDALASLPQVNPSNEEDPYYGSAREYFDKVFHDRIAIPPLRGPSLSAWCSKQVEQKGGLWEELRNRLDEREMGKLLYDLIPSHITSPRRARSLLNSFARTVVVAENRGIAWEGRELEVAKLVVLESEFPHVGRDLRVHHRLPGLILDPPAEPSPRVAGLLGRYGVVPESQSPDGSDQGDEVKAAQVSIDKRLAVGSQRTELENLVRYLERTRSTTISKDLIFMESAGTALGMDDPELGHTLDLAVDAPDDVVARFHAESIEDRRQAVRVLASNLRNEGREESRMIFRALLGIASGLATDLGSVPNLIANDLVIYLREQDLETDQKVPVLELSLASDDSPFRSAAMRTPGLLKPELIGSVAMLLPRMTKSFKGRVYEAIGTTIGTDHDPLPDLIVSLPGDEVVALMNQEAIYNGLFNYLSNDDFDASEREQYASNLFDSLEDRNDAQAAVVAFLGLMTTEELLPELVADHADRVIPQIEDPRTKNELTMRVMEIAGPNKAPDYAEILQGPEDGDEALAPVALRVIKGLLLSTSAQPDPDAAARLARSAGIVLPFVVHPNEQAQQEVRDGYWAALQSKAWWESEAATRVQEELHQQMLTVEFWDEEAEPVNLIFQDVSRIEPHIAFQQVTSEKLELLRQLGTPLASLHAGLVDLARNPVPEESDDIATDLTYTRALFSFKVREAGFSVEPGISLEEVARCAAASTGPNRTLAVEYWFRLGPASDDVREVLLVAASKERVAKALARWAKTQAEDKLTRLAIELAQRFEYNDIVWVETLLDEGANDVELTKVIVEATRGEANGDVRSARASYLAKLGERSPASQTLVADLMLHSLSKSQQVDFKVALKLIPALGSDHKRGSKLTDAFKASAENGMRLNADQFKQLRARSLSRLPEYTKKSNKSSVGRLANSISSVLKRR